MYWTTTYTFARTVPSMRCKWKGPTANIATHTRKCALTEPNESDREGIGRYNDHLARQSTTVSLLHFQHSSFVMYWCASANVGRLSFSCVEPILFAFVSFFYENDDNGLFHSPALVHQLSSHEYCKREINLSYRFDSAHEVAIRMSHRWAPAWFRP